MSSPEQPLADAHRGLASAAGMISGMLARRHISPRGLVDARDRAGAALKILEALAPPASKPRTPSRRASE